MSAAEVQDETNRLQARPSPKKASDKKTLTTAEEIDELPARQRERTNGCADSAEEMVAMIFRRVPIGRIMMITDSVAASWRGDGPMQLGGLDAEIRGGVVRLKTGELAGSTLKFNEGLANVFRITGLPLGELVKTTSWNQARSLGLEGVGKLEPGYAADVVMLDGDFTVRDVWVAGRRVI